MASKYDKLEEIGAGTFGRAWLVRRRDTDKKYVIKEIQVVGMSEKEKFQSLVEVEALAKCKHVNIIRYREAFVDNGVLSIAMEYGDGGDLKTKIQEANGTLFPENTILDWFVQLAFALKYIHALHILHRDLKSQNIFIVGKDTLKLGDFGIARILENTVDKACTAIGTPYYLSPEICRRKRYNSKSDIWALGCVLYELCCLHHPFDGNNLSSLVVTILQGKFTPIPSQYGSLLDDLVHALLQVEPTERPSAAQVLAIPALQSAINKYICRVKLARSHSTSTPSPNYLKPRGKQEGKITSSNVKAAIDADKENMQPKKKSKDCSIRRVSWATPKASPLVECTRVTNSAEVHNPKERKKSNVTSPKASPTISLYREALKKWKDAERCQQMRRRLSVLRKAPGTPLPHRTHAPHSKVAQNKLGLKSPKVGKAAATEYMVAKIPDDKTYTVRRASESAIVGIHRCSETPDTMVTTPEIRISCHEEVADGINAGESYLSICRHLYDSCSVRSLEESISKLETVRGFLEAHLGAHEFLRDYTAVREALARGRNFSQIEGLVKGSLREYFPLVIQLIQMECCSKL